MMAGAGDSEGRLVWITGHPLSGVSDARGHAPCYPQTDLSGEQLDALLGRLQEVLSERPSRHRRWWFRRWLHAI